MRRQKTKIFEASSAEDMGRQYPEINKILSIQAGFYSNMLIPLFSNDAIIGVLHFRSKKHNAYSDAVISLAERIGMQIAGAIANAQMFKNLSKTEMSLRESEGRFRALVEQAAVGVAEIDMGTGRFLIVNRRLCEMVGRTEAELLATTFQAITHPDDLHLHDEKMALLMAGKIGYYSLEKRYVRKDGTIICVNITVSPLWNPGEKPGRNMIVVEDITERKQAEQDLKQAHRQLTSLFNGARDAIFIVDIATGLILDANDEAAQLLNLPRETLIGLHHSQLHPAEKADFHRKRFLERSQISNPNLVEAEVSTSDGRRISVEISARSIELSDGKRAMVAIFREITERKQAEDSLRKQANKLSSIFRAAPVGIGMVINRVIQEANDTLCQMTGYFLEELLGRDARMLYPTQEDYDYVGQEKYRQIGEKRIGTVETRWKRKDGRIIDIMLSSTPLDPDDLPKGVTFTALDITERKRAEKTLQRQNIYLESLNETALGLMRRKDLKDIFQAILDRAMRFFGTDEGWIFIYHFQEGVFEYKAAMGKREYRDRIACRSRQWNQRRGQANGTNGSD